MSLKKSHRHIFLRYFSDVFFRMFLRLCQKDIFSTTLRKFWRHFF